MKFIVAVLLIVGSVVASIIAAYLFATFVYFLVALMVFVKILAKNIMPYLSKTLTNEGKDTNNCAQNGWYREYIKYVIRNYLSLFFCNNRIAKAYFKCLNKCRYKQRHYERQKNIVNLAQIPFNEKSLYGIHHNDNVALSKDDVNQNGTLPCKVDAFVESHGIYLTCREVATLYKASSSIGTIDADFFSALQDEVSRELRLMEMEEAESAAIAKRLEQLYLEVHPSDNLRTIPGVGDITAPIFLATVGDPARFRSQSSFANYCGIVPGANQSSNSEAKGLSMTKAGPAIMRWALFQAGGIGRAHDPQLACVYYREMVHNGKTHMQAMGAVMSHMSARILAVLREDKPYDLRDMDGRPVTREEARRIILSKYQVPEEIRKERRHRKTPGNYKLQKTLREMLVPRTYEAAEAPQPVVT